MVETLNRKIRKSNKKLTFKQPKRSNTVKIAATKGIKVETPTPIGDADIED